MQSQQTQWMGYDQVQYIEINWAKELETLSPVGLCMIREPQARFCIGRKEVTIASVGGFQAGIDHSIKSKQKETHK